MFLKFLSGDKIPKWEYAGDVGRWAIPKGVRKVVDRRSVNKFVLESGLCIRILPTVEGYWSADEFCSSEI